MSFTVQKKTKKSDLILRRTDVVTYKLPNGNIISSEGLPEGLTDENLEAVIAAVEDKDKLKVNLISITYKLSFITLILVYLNFQGTKITLNEKGEEFP